MTKKEMAEIITRSPAWEGTRSVKELCRDYTKEQIKDAYDELDNAEEDYYNERYS